MHVAKSWNLAHKTHTSHKGGEQQEDPGPEHKLAEEVGFDSGNRLPIQRSDARKPPPATAVHKKPTYFTNVQVEKEIINL